ncbi:helicase HerA-like domain-containing protein [Ferriphaselus sp. R-1]|uniref:helicase HerA-like domain-containing protein n=1 Tax=Ferriphaselus sp. R-1 TaxID=1485544 RepID=UPI0005508D60|nr:helicase HerA-like domain-containing protein [Ferriphaselus sp. R-1]
MTAPLLIAKNTDHELVLLPQMANRHGLITGATGTGKTVTLQSLAESFSRIGVPVFLSDIKGDLSGLAKTGGGNAKVEARVEQLQLEDYENRAYPVTFWDVSGEQGHPVRATISDMGPLLLGRMLNLNEVQQGVLTLVFKIADDSGLLLLDFKDLRAMVQHVGENAKSFTSEYGNISTASVGAIQRGLLELEHQGADAFFGEPMLNIDDLMQTDAQGAGMINILAADKLLNSPKVYSTLLLWLLSELYENLPEAGDLEKPRLVFFFDEAHLLFNDAPAILLDKVEQVVRLIRSKGVGVYFVTQNPTDVPDKVLSQLGNRVQHALRAFSVRDQKAVRAAAETMRDNPELDEQAAITELGVGEALVSLLDEKGRPTIVERAFIVPPRAQIGPLTAAERQHVIQSSLLAGHYEAAVDRESAYERLKGRAAQAAEAEQAAASSPAQSNGGGLLGSIFGNDDAPRRSARQPQSVGEAILKSAARTIGSEVGRQLIRGVLGSLLGGRR